MIVCSLSALVMNVTVETDLIQCALVLPERALFGPGTLSRRKSRFIASAPSKIFQFTFTRSTAYVLLLGAKQVSFCIQDRVDGDALMSNCYAGAIPIGKV